MKARATRQTDNSHLAVKLEIRRRICGALGEPLAVLDCCAAAGVIWRRLRAELPVERYVPIDRKPDRAAVPETLRLDSRAALERMDLAAFNVVDVDTYGEPWDHWLTACRRIARRTAVFLTHGFVSVAGGNVSRTVRRELGIPAAWPIPIGPALAKLSASFLLSRGCKSARLRSALRWTSSRVDYYGLILEPAGRAGGKGKRT